MPIIKSARKALRVSTRRKAENDVVRILLRKNIKAVRIKKTAAELIAAQSALAIAAKKNVIHKNKASRLTSRLAKVVALHSKA